VTGCGAAPSWRAGRREWWAAPSLARLMPFLPAPFTRRPLPASRQMRRPVFNRVSHFCALRAGELGAACPHFHESACELQ